MMKEWSGGDVDESCAIISVFWVLLWRSTGGGDQVEGVLHGFWGMSQT